MGNLTQLLTDGDLTKVVIPAIDPSTNRLLPAKTGATYFGSHDASGNLVSTLSTAYAYDGLNMMKEATGPNGQHDVYVYNADDERIGTIAVSGDFASPSVTPTSYHWTIRGLGNEVLREFDDTLGAGGAHNWSWKEDYIYANGHLLAAETSGATLHFFPDHLGTPRVITGSTGTVISKHTYYPFGDEISVKEQDSETHRFTGHERDPSLDYMHARYYASSAGRFLSVDPDGDTARRPSWNRYAYARNNPVRLIDLDGRKEIEFTIRHFIQQQHVFSPFGNVRGDSRSVSLNSAASFRTQLVLRVDSQTGRMRQFADTGISHNFTMGINGKADANNWHNEIAATSTRDARQRYYQRAHVCCRAVPKRTSRPCYSADHVEYTDCVVT
jgi:RHS repeat-associated protein